ncbi:hypothetical protein [Micromonospora endolithica]|uniref:Twin-arginine translocation signal domain-containing protein n=1 Tax=Micromonospora endolithica TaxID=230091 RepID=A0A3A9ZMP2_9ACTN|nr:hypothetical protein [Micromonospora endolithica]RKN49572.1 hypothetical protein D7223_08885 [Micromonospora endolithica]TWJ23793.1 hypothetical protein JD76_03936 [Micromonospora endolithica]
MNETLPSLSRRRVLVGAAAASAAVTVTGSTAAHAAPNSAVPAGVSRAPTGSTRTALVVRDRIATASLRPGPARFQTDLHRRLTAWLAFWSANSPAEWTGPVEVAGHVDPDGGAFTLHAIRSSREDRVFDAFTAGRADAAHLATLASLHHHFPQVGVEAGGAVRVTHGPAGFTGSADQVAFAVTACRELWGVRAAGADSWRSLPYDGWAAFTRASLRRGLRTG